MRVALAPINPTVGDLAGNAALIAAAADDARAAGCDAALLPELALCGYPPKDLLMHEGFVPACEAAAGKLGSEHSAGVTLIFGTPLTAPAGTTNSLLAFRDGRRVARYDKRLLPTYDVFDENRYFVPGDRPVVIEVPTPSGPVRVGLAICEDLWKGEDAGFESRYLGPGDPVAELVAARASVIVSPSASPFVLGKQQKHREILACHARRHGVRVVSLNQLGANDDLIFDGHALAFARDGNIFAANEPFRGGVSVIELAATQASIALEPSDDDQLFRALVLGIRDYLRKTGFRSALIGLSGGIDSALTAALAAAALGPANVLGVLMPSPYSSEHSKADALDTAARLGVATHTIPIETPFAAFRATLDPAFAQRGHAALGAITPDLTEENLQSRVRGTLLMALSNRTGAMVLTTGNKSELAVGYCTLYGDMNGGLAVLSDVSKQWVYRLSRWLNANHAAAGFGTPPIPPRSIDKAPSAELRPNQTDQDSLPPYDVLDAILERAVEGRQSAATIARETGYDAALVARIIRMVDLAEYKRKQAAVGLKVTTIAFGSGRRHPIAQRWPG